MKRTSVGWTIDGAVHLKGERAAAEATLIKLAVRFGYLPALTAEERRARRLEVLRTISR